MGSRELKELVVMDVIRGKSFGPGHLRPVLAHWMGIYANRLRMRKPSVSAKQVKELAQDRAVLAKQLAWLKVRRPSDRKTLDDAKVELMVRALTRLIAQLDKIFEALKRHAASMRDFVRIRVIPVAKGAPPPQDDEDEEEKRKDEEDEEEVERLLLLDKDHDPKKKAKAAKKKRKKSKSKDDGHDEEAPSEE